MNSLTLQTSTLSISPKSSPAPPPPPSPGLPPPRRYRLVIELLDTSTPALTTDTSSSPLSPKTPTGLPPQLDQQVRAKAKKLVLPQSFWQRLPTTRPLDLTPRSHDLSRELFSQEIDQRPERVPESASGPKIWSENFGVASPAAIATSELFTPSKQSKPKQTAQLDHRFGPISVNWIDNPTPLMPTSPPTSPGISPAGHLSSSPSTFFPISPRTASASLPALPPHPPQTAGSTDLNYGIVHLYREAGADDSTAKEKNAAAAADDGTVVGLVSVPGILTAAWLLGFIAPALDSIAQIRMVRDSRPNRSMVLIKFREAADAAQFMFVYNHKPYHETKDSEVCHVVSISSIKLQSTTTPPFTFPYSTDIDPAARPTDAVEIPTCPVCLERLDSSVTGVVQIACSHSYHCSCLLKWGDSRCPVCRQTQVNARNRSRTLTSPPASNCSVCQSASNLWACLICGNVGCGRYQGGHAHSHFDESGHSFSLELETQRVWDYVQDQYVHRLIRNRTDGKLVELPSLAGKVNANPLDDDEKPEGSGARGPDRSAEATQDKVEQMGLEYSALMTSQLDSQRVYFEEEVARAKDEQAVVSRKWEEALAEQARQKKAAQEKEREAAEARARVEKEKAAVAAKLEATARQAAEDEARRKKEAKEAVKARKELERQLEAEQAVTKSLTDNLGALREEVKARERETAEVKAEVADLQEQMRDLMFALTARDQIEQAGGAANEAAGGSISVPTPPPPSSSAARRKKKR